MQDDHDDLEALKANFAQLKASISHELSRGLSIAARPPPPRIEALPPLPPQTNESNDFHSLREDLRGRLASVPERSVSAAGSPRGVPRLSVDSRLPAVEPLYEAATASATAAMQSLSKKNRVVLTSARPSTAAGGPGLFSAMDRRREAELGAAFHRGAHPACPMSASAAAASSAAIGDTDTERGRVSISVHGAGAGVDRVSISASAASSNTVIVGGAALRAALESHKANYDFKTSVSKPKHYVKSRPTTAGRLGAPALATAARARRAQRGHAPGLNHVRATERELVRVVDSARVGAQPAKKRGGGGDGDEHGGEGDEYGDADSEDIGDGATAGESTTNLLYTHGVGAKPKTAQQAWAAAVAAEARDRQIMSSVMTHSEKLVAQVLAQLD